MWFSTTVYLMKSAFIICSGPALAESPGGVLDKILPTENLKFADYKLNFGSP